MKSILLALSFLIFIISCKQENSRDCIKNTGSRLREKRATSDFTQIELNNDINLYLKPDTVNIIEIEAGKNLLDLISVDVTDGVLSLKNNNKCNWVRKFHPTINAYVSYKTLDKITYRGSGLISTLSPIKQNKFILDCWEGNGSVDISCETNEIYFVINKGECDIKACGSSGFTYIYTNGNGPINCENIIADEGYVWNNATNDCYITASKKLKIVINYIGNVYYQGNPTELISEINNKGNIIRVCP